MSPVLAVVIGVLAVSGALLVLMSALAMLRERDALSRINVLSPATGMGLPLIVVASYLHRLGTDGFTWTGLLQAVVTLAALWVVSSVASNVLARSAYLSGAPVAPDTHPQDLGRDLSEG